MPIRSLKNDSGSLALPDRSTRKAGRSGRKAKLSVSQKNYENIRFTSVSPPTPVQPFKKVLCVGRIYQHLNRRPYRITYMSHHANDEILESLRDRFEAARQSGNEEEVQSVLSALREGGWQFEVEHIEKVLLDEQEVDVK